MILRFSQQNPKDSALKDETRKKLLVRGGARFYFDHGVLGGFVMRSVLPLLLLVSVSLLWACESNFSVSTSRRAAAGDCKDETFISANPDTCSDSTEQAHRAMKLRMDDCVDPDLSKVLNTESITLCDGTQAKGKLSIAATDIKSGARVAGIAGSFSGAYSNCTSEGEQDCINAGVFKAADTTGLASKVISTDSVAGVSGNVVLPSATDVVSGVTFGKSGTALTGSKFPTKQCRNAADLATWDTSGPSNLSINYPGMAANATNVATGTDELNWNPTTYYLTTDFPVQLTTTGTMPGGLLASTTYYVIVSGTKIKLASSAGGAAIDITSTGSGSLRLSPDPDASVGVWDTIDDYNNNLTTAPNLSPWAASYVCDDTNFTDVSSSGDPDMTPPNTTPAGATAAFSEIWRDDLTGLHFTNILYDGSGTVSWAGGMAMCAGLDSGDGAGNWRMPTQKELMQLYIDGISKVTVAGGDWATSGSGYMWSSSALSNLAYNAWVASLANGNSKTNNRANTFFGVFCVR